ncbi:hypothetical protein JVU11DRAFT_11025, partial [Chiua virens]
MAPVATNENGSGQVGRVEELKKQANVSQLFNPFYSPTADSTDNETYRYAAYKVSDFESWIVLDTNNSVVLQPHFPVVNWEPLEEVDVTDRGQFADIEKKALFSAAKK